MLMFLLDFFPQFVLLLFRQVPLLAIDCLDQKL